MPRHNEVFLYGQVPRETTMGYNTNDVNDPNRKLYRTSNVLRVIRGIRDFGATDKRLRVDAPLIATSNQALMAKMRLMHPGDMYIIKGTVATLDGTAAFTCPLCGKTFLVPAVYTYVNPICIIPMEAERQISWDEAIKKTMENKEMSNIVRVMGRVASPVRAFQTEAGQLIVNYTLDVSRKFHIKEDKSDVKHDFPVIKSYGSVAYNDYFGVVEEGEVFVDGMLQTRTFKRSIECPHCMQESEYDDSITEVVAYSTEYLYGCRPMEEIKKLQEEKQAEDSKKAANELLEKLGLPTD